MVLRTFMSSNLFNEFTLFHPESPLTALTNQPDTYMIGAAWVLWNETTSKYKIYVKSVRITNQMTQDTATGTSKLDIQRISGYTESLMTGTAAYVTKMDSNNATLPTQVKCLTRLAEVSGGTTTRSFMNMASQSLIPLSMTSRTVAFQVAKKVGSTASGLNCASVQSCGYGNSTVQSWTLNEGEGLAIVPATVQTNIAYRMSMTFTTGTQYYIMSETLRPVANMIPMMLFNGSGSGVVLNVKQIEIHEIGSDDVCSFAIQKIEDVFPDKYGTDVTSTVFSMDSSYTLPVGIKMYEDCLVNLYGVKRGAIITNPSYRRNTQQWLGTGPTWAIGTRMYGIVSSSEVIDNGTYPITLHPGEGLALIQKNASGMGRYGANVLFQIDLEDPSTHATASVN